MHLKEVIVFPDLPANETPELLVRPLNSARPFRSHGDAQDRFNRGESMQVVKSTRTDAFKPGDTISKDSVSRVWIQTESPRGKKLIMLQWYHEMPAERTEFFAQFGIKA